MNERIDPFKSEPEEEEDQESFFSRNMNILIVIGGCLLVGTMFIIASGGSITGASVFDFSDTTEPVVEKSEYEVIGERLNQIDASFSSFEEKFDQCTVLSQQLSSDLATTKTELSTCVTNVENLTSLNVVLQDEKSKLVSQDIMNLFQQEMIEKKNTIAQLEEHYDAIVKNAARTICCKQRVDDASIDSYVTGDEKIFCTHNGDKPLDC